MNNKEQNSIDEKLSTEINLDEIRDMYFIKRNFRKLGDKSLRLGVLNFLTCSLGAGILFIPYLFMQFGLINGVIFLFLNLIFSKYSFDLYIKFMKNSKKNDLYYIVNYYLGNKWAMISKISTILASFILSVIYIISAWNFIENFLSNFITIKLKDDYSKINFIYRSIFLVITFIILVPLVIKKDMNSLKMFTFVFLFLLSYTILVFFIQSFSFYTNYIVIEENKGIFNHFTLFKMPNLNWFGYYDSLVISFYCHSNCFKIWEEIDRPTIKRCKKIVNISLIIEFMIYLSFGVIGYIVLGDHNMEEIASLRKHYDGKSLDIFMAIGNWLYGIGLIVGAAFFYPIISSEIRSILKMETNKKNLILTGVIPLIVLILITLLYPNIMKILSILGGIFLNFVGYFLPTYIEIIDLGSKKRINYIKIILNYVIIVALVFLAIFSIY